jgi:hypothetical protein
MVLPEKPDPSFIFLLLQLAHDGYLRYIVSAAAITTGLAVIFALALSCQTNLLLKVEVPFAWVNLVMWIIAVRFIFHSTNLATTVGEGIIIISNANIYYFR